MLIRQDNVMYQRGRISSMIKILERHLENMENIEYIFKCMNYSNINKLTTHIFQTKSLISEMKDNWNNPDEFITNDIIQEFKKLQSKIHQYLS